MALRGVYRKGRVMGAIQSSNTNVPWYVGHNGATNFTRHEAQKFARNIVESQDYRDSLDRRIKADSLAPAVECMLWHYAYGKPIEQVNLNVTAHEDLSALGLDELYVRAQELAKQLEEAQQLADAIPAEFRAA